MYGLSIWFGTALITARVVADTFVSWHHVRLVHQLNSGETEFTRPSHAGSVLAAFLAFVGIATAI
jgi:hypothetical protein